MESSVPIALDIPYIDSEPDRHEETERPRPIAQSQSVSGSARKIESQIQTATAAARKIARQSPSVPAG